MKIVFKKQETNPLILMDEKGEQLNTKYNKAIEKVFEKFLKDVRKTMCPLCDEKTCTKDEACNGVVHTFFAIIVQSLCDQFEEGQCELIEDLQTELNDLLEEEKKFQALK